jgi:hypothetical protein
MEEGEKSYTEGTEEEAQRAQRGMEGGLLGSYLSDAYVGARSRVETRRQGYPRYISGFLLASL